MTDSRADDLVFEPRSTGAETVTEHAPDITDAVPDPVTGAGEPGAEAALPPPGQAARRRRTLVLAVVLTALGLLGAMWTLASPIGAAPDDDFHLASIWCSPTAPDDVCTDLGFSYAGGQTFVDVPAEVGPKWCFAGFNRNSAACADDIVPGTVARSLANDGIYPDLYYLAMGLTVGDSPVDSALLARMVSWSVSLLLLAAGWSVLPRQHRLGYLTILLVAAVPHGVFLWASTNPSGVVMAAVSAAWCAVVALLGGLERRELAAPAALLVAATVVAAGSRSDGGLYEFIAVASACILVWRPEREAMRRTAGVVAIAAAGLLASIVVLTRRLEAIGLDGLTSPQIESPPAGSLWFNVLEVPYFIVGNFGQAGLGWLDTPMPRMVWVTTFVVFAVLAFRGIARTDLAKGLSLLAVLAGLLVVPSYLLWRAGTTVGFEIQPRYVLPLLPVLGFTALHRRRGSGVVGLTGLQLSIVFGLVTVAHSIALHANIRRYVTGIDVTSPNLDADREWWWDIPITPNMVWLGGTIAFGALAAVLGTAIHRAEPDEPAADPGTDDEPALSGSEFEATTDRPYA